MKLRDAQTIKREALLQLDNGTYQQKLAIDEMVGFNSRLDTQTMMMRQSVDPLESGGGLTINSERFLIDQTQDHELDSLLSVLTHNLRIIGYPIDAPSDAIYLKSWHHPLQSMDQLCEDFISIVDPVGYSYLMPCLAQNPTQTRKKREAHKHFYVNVMSESV